MSLRSRTSHEDGFTLVELLTVVVVIGLLSSIALPRFLGQRERAATASAISTLRGAYIAVPELLVDTGNFPSEAAVETQIERQLRTFDIVGPADGSEDTHMISVSTSGGQRLVMATRSVMGECFFQRVDVEGNVARHRTSDAVCSADAFQDADVPSGW